MALQCHLARLLKPGASAVDPVHNVLIVLNSMRSAEIKDGVASAERALVVDRPSEVVDDHEAADFYEIVQIVQHIDGRVVDVAVESQDCETLPTGLQL